MPQNMYMFVSLFLLVTVSFRSYRHTPFSVRVFVAVVISLRVSHRVILFCNKTFIKQSLCFVVFDFLPPFSLSCTRELNKLFLSFLMFNVRILIHVHVLCADALCISYVKSLFTHKYICIQIHFIIHINLLKTNAAHILHITHIPIHMPMCARVHSFTWRTTLCCIMSSNYELRVEWIGNICPRKWKEFVSLYISFIRQEENCVKNQTKNKTHSSCEKTFSIASYELFEVRCASVCDGKMWFVVRCSIMLCHRIL